MAKSTVDIIALEINQISTRDRRHKIKKEGLRIGFRLEDLFNKWPSCQDQRRKQGAVHQPKALQKISRNHQRKLLLLHLNLSLVSHL